MVRQLTLHYPRFVLGFFVPAILRLRLEIVKKGLSIALAIVLICAGYVYINRPTKFVYYVCYQFGYQSTATTGFGSTCITTTEPIRDSSIVSQVENHVRKIIEPHPDTRDLKVMLINWKLLHTE